MYTTVFLSFYCLSWNSPSYFTFPRFYSLLFRLLFWKNFPSFCFFLAFFWNMTFEPHLFFTATFISTRYIFQLTFLFRVHIILFAHAIPTFYMTSFDSAIFALVDTLGFDFMWNILFSRENRGRSLGWIKFYRERRKMSGKFIPPHTAYAAYKSEPLDSYIHRLFAKIVDIII